MPGTVLGLEIHQRQINKHPCPCKVQILVNEYENERIKISRALFTPKSAIFCFPSLII